MKWTDRPLSCARAQVLLEPYLDGDLRPERRVRLKAHLQTCAACRDEMQMAKRLRAALQALPEREAPAAVAAAVARQTRGVAGSIAAPASIVDLGSWASQHWRPMVAAGALAATITLAVLLTRPPRVHQPNAAELARAETQVRWVMTQFAAISQKTVREHVFEDRVLVPAANAVENAVETVRETTPNH